MTGANPLDAIRAIDTQHDEQKAQAETAIDEVLNPPKLRNSFPPGPYSQGLAGMLMTKEEEFKRVSAELSEREAAAQATLDQAEEIAKAAYEQARTAALTNWQKAIDGIDAERSDLTRARDGIKAAIEALT